MSYGFTDAQLALAEQVREFADTVVAPASYEYDTKRELPYDIIAQMGQMGLFALPFPQEFGGSTADGDFLSFCLAVEQIARADQSLAVTLEAGIGLGAMPILRFGSQQQKETWLPMLASGEALAAFGLTEAVAGSDAGATQTTAVLDGDEWVINGTKEFITNSGSDITKLITIVAVSGEVTKSDGSTAPELSAFLVPVPTPGLQIGPAYDKMGWHTSDTHPLTFTDMRLPKQNLLGERGRGFAYAVSCLDGGRIAFAALAAGAARGCLEQAVAYAKERVVFGRSIDSNQHIAFTLARMATKVHSARLAWVNAAQLMMAGQPYKEAASMAKLICSEAAIDCAHDASHIFGGNGYLNKNVVARHYRDSKVLEVGEGTTEVQLMVIARSLGLSGGM